jgi:exodeoxyribonuclease VII small subunit
VRLTVPVTDADFTAPTDAPDVGTLTYEQARDELVQVVSRLEAGGEPLEASLALWERGEKLAARCQEWLDGARERLAAAQSTTGTAATPAEEA